MKKNQKVSDETFWHLPIKPICKIQWFHLTTVNFQPKTFLILYPSLEKSTTGIAILIIQLTHQIMNIIRVTGQAKIWYFDHFGSIKQAISGCQISMDKFLFG